MPSPGKTFPKTHTEEKTLEKQQIIKNFTLGTSFAL
jgi:hypothetical protein